MKDGAAPTGVRVVASLLPALGIMWLGVSRLHLAGVAKSRAADWLGDSKLDQLLAFAAGAAVFVVLLVAAIAVYLVAYGLFMATLRGIFATVVAGAILGVMAMSIASVDSWGDESTGDVGTTDDLVTSLFDDNLIAFEVLGVLLTAAMIGALVIGRPLDAVADESHYHKPNPKELEATIHAADVKEAPK